MRTATVLAILAVFQCSLAFPQQTGRPTLAACDGQYNTVRVSTIKPGKLQAFMDAVAAHKAWYRSHGFKENVIVASRVIDTKTGKYVESEVVTFHVNPPDTSTFKTDAAWDAYVKQYRDSSDIKEQYTTCMPKLVP
jgi:hypothetical protein